MATIRRRVRGDGTAVFEVQVRVRGFEPRTASFARVTDAKIWSAKTEAGLRERRLFPERESEKRSFRQLVELYLARPDVPPDYARQLTWWRQRLGDLRLVDVTAERISDARRTLETEKSKSGRVRSPATVKRYLAALSAVFSFARRQLHWCRINPVQEIAKPKEPGGRVRYLSTEERGALLKECASDRDLHDLVMLAICTGARAGELLALRWRDVDLSRRRASLEHTKNGDRRALPITGPAVDILRERDRLRVPNDDRVFPISTVRPHSWYSKRFAAAVSAAKIEDFRFHDLRHTAATYLLESGATLPELAGILGHRTLAMVKRYAHVSEAHGTEVAARMTSKIFASGGVPDDKAA